MRDLHNNIDTARVLLPVTLTTTAGAAAKIVDLQGYQGVEFIINYGSVTATNATITPTVKEGDVTGTMTSVADANLLGLEANAALGQAATRTSGVSKNVSKRIGYIGTKRYVTCSLFPTVTAASVCAVTAIRGKAGLAPLAT